MKLKGFWIMALVLALVLCLLPARHPARAATYTVTNTNDSGPGSLRQAIIDANNHSGPDTIEFNISIAGNYCDFQTGVCTIRPISRLPTLTDDHTTINGYTQPGTVEATGTTSATLKIVIDGSNTDSRNDGLIIQSDYNVIRGLVINRFSDGIYLYGSGGSNNTISGNYVGTDASGTVDLGNTNYGIRMINGIENNTVGGNTAADRNVISGNDYGGIYISGGGSTGNIFSGNYIGTDANGTTDLGNTGSGVYIGHGAQNNTVGGTTAGERNVISGNGSGVYISGSHAMSNIVSGNYIGTDSSGMADLGNTYKGIDIVLEAHNNTIGPGNLIAHNGQAGVAIRGSGTMSNTITQNSIFSNGFGISLAEGANGGIAAPVIVATTPGSVDVLGTACPGCTVELFENSDTDGEGEIYVGDTAADATGAFTVTVDSLSRPYLTATATDPVSGTSKFSAVFTARLPYVVDTTADENDGSCGDGNCSLRDAIILANDNPGPDAIEFNIPWSGNFCSWSSGVCTIRPSSPLPTLTSGDTTINGYTQSGAAEATGTMPAAVKIVIDGRDTGSPLADGLTIESASNAIKGLVICDFSGNGVEISGDDATGNTISGNYIGTDADGGVNGNADNGVCIHNGAQNNFIGGNAPAERNVISFNGRFGVCISGSDTTSNTISGNYIGTNAEGTAAWRNGGDGVYIGSGRNNTIGGATSDERNVISGNDGHGIHILGSNNTISGNYVGTDASGTADLGNAGRGVHIGGGGGHNTIERNVISGNGWDGVGMSGSTVEHNTICGNYVGTDAAGTADLGNTQAGVELGSGAKYNTVGPGNLIAYNSEDGVQVSGGSGAISNTITQNSIFSNALGIHLLYGANGGITAPEIVTTTLESVNVVGSACPGCTVELFENSDTDGEGETYVGDTTADLGGAFTLTVDFLSDPYLTATATDPVSGTSEFSTVFTATVSGAPPARPVYLPIAMKNY